MKTETQHSIELVRISELIGDMTVAMLTTLDSTGELVSRPMAPLLLDSAGTFWFFTDLRSASPEQLSKVNLSFTDPQHATYVSLSGSGELDRDRGRMQHLWTPFAKPWFPDGPESADLALLKVVPSTVEYWDAPSSKMIRMLAMAASVLASRPIALGDHDRLTTLATARLAQ